MTEANLHQGKDGGGSISSRVGMEKRGVAGFFTGPYFKVIPIEKIFKAKKEKKRAARSRCSWLSCCNKAPAQDDVQTNHELEPASSKLDQPLNGEKGQPPEDYLGALKRIIVSDVDTDDVYGLTNEELVPLPFEVPRATEYIVDVLQGLALVTQATFVMFLAIMQDNDLRGSILGDTYQKSFLPLIKALVVAYPLVTLSFMTIMICEMAARKYMYYRLLSMRILVDWENNKIWQGLFFYYFIITWALFNLWCIYGVVKVSDRVSTPAHQTVQFNTLVVVNLQTLQLILQYQRLMTSEQRLVSLNQIFERAPIEAQTLLTYTYVIEEEVLRKECQAFFHSAKKIFKNRLLNLMTCGVAAKGWNKTTKEMKFNIEILKYLADNRSIVDANTKTLRHLTVKESENGAAPSGASPIGAVPSGAHAIAIAASDRPAATYTHDIAAHNNTPADGSPYAATGPQPAFDRDSDIARSSHSSAHQAPHHPTDAENPHQVTVRDVQLTVEEEVEQRERFFAEEAAAATWWQKLDNVIEDWVYKQIYATLHCAFIAVLRHFPTWPYRGDIAYFRMLLCLELTGVAVVAGIVIFGIMRATDARPCEVVERTCQTCYNAATQTVGQCAATYNISLI